MRKVVAFEWMSLDGVVQAPAYANEDTSNGFKHGGWHVRYFDERSMKWVIENVSQAGGFLLGVLESFGAGLVSSAYKDAFAFVALIGICLAQVMGWLPWRVVDEG